MQQIVVTGIIDEKVFKGIPNVNSYLYMQIICIVNNDSLFIFSLIQPAMKFLTANFS